jgi:uncharacterized protein YfbU (UPF0304 family)
MRPSLATRYDFFPLLTILPRATMKLSRTERWILANQYRILAKLHPESAAMYTDYAKALERGYAKVIDRLGEMIRRDDTNETESEEVDSVLALYDVLQRGFRTLEDPEGVEEEELRFIGFDAKTEGDYLGYAHFALASERRYPNLATAPDLNCGIPMVRRYRRMLQEWKSLDRPSKPSAKEIRAILKAGRKG